ncbi:MAG TPA: glycine zipper domain-containing protein [Allocoleopsis sp.]
MSDRNNQPSVQSQNQEGKSNQNSTNSHPLATGLGAVGGGAAGAAIGDSVGGKLGAAVGSVAGAIAGGILGNKVAEIATEAIAELQPSLGVGANNKPVELPRHYSWEELQALSKPQSAHAS